MDIIDTKNNALKVTKIKNINKDCWYITLNSNNFIK